MNRCSVSAIDGSPIAVGADPRGIFVLHKDAEALTAEVERLREAGALLCDETDGAFASERPIDWSAVMTANRALRQALAQPSTTEDESVCGSCGSSDRMTLAQWLGEKPSTTEEPQWSCVECGFTLGQSFHPADEASPNAEWTCDKCNGSMEPSPTEKSQAINVIFDGPPAHESGRFIEVETDEGRSIGCGEWSERDDGLWSLRIAKLPSPTEEPTCKTCRWSCLCSPRTDRCHGRLHDIETTHVRCQSCPSCTKKEEPTCPECGGASFIHAGGRLDSSAVKPCPSCTETNP